jgi:hypothetical protein
MQVLSETTKVWNDNGKLLKIKKIHFNNVNYKKTTQKMEKKQQSIQTTKLRNKNRETKKHWYRVIHVFTLNKVWKNML